VATWHLLSWATGVLVATCNTDEQQAFLLVASWHLGGHLDFILMAT